MGLLEPAGPRVPYLARGRWCEWWVTRRHAWVPTRLTSPAIPDIWTGGFCHFGFLESRTRLPRVPGPGLLGGSTDRQEEIGGSPLSSVSPVPCLPTFLPLVSPSPLDQGRLLLICRWPGSVLSSSLPQILSAARPSSFLLTSCPSMAVETGRRQSPSYPSTTSSHRTSSPTAPYPPRPMALLSF